jgi:hypothetical protein
MALVYWKELPMGLKLTVAVVAVAALGLAWSASPAHAQTPGPAATVAVSATAPVSPTAVVTATAPVSPTAAVSETWYALTDGAGAFALQFPPSWTASQDEQGRITRESSDAEILSVMVVTGTTAPAEVAVDRWVNLLKPALDNLGEKVVEDQRGKWDRGLSGAYARLATVNVNGQNEELVLVLPASDGRILAVTDMQSGAMLTEENLARLERILTSVRLSVRADQPLPAPVPATAQKLTGRGPQPQTPTVKLAAGQVTFRLSHDGQERFTIWLLDAQGQRAGFLIDAAGVLKRVYSFAVPRDGDYRFDVTADGAWIIGVEQ